MDSIAKVEGRIRANMTKHLTMCGRLGSELVLHTPDADKYIAYP